MTVENKIKSGYWAISTQKHLKQFIVDSPGMGHIGNLNTAGKVGRFLGLIRGNVLIEDMRKIEQMAYSVGINSKYELKTGILPLIADASDQRVELRKDAKGEVIGIAEYLYEPQNVLQISGQALETLSPEPCELITIETMDETKKIPFLQDDLTELLVRKGFTEENVNYTYQLLKQFRLIQLYEKN
ncbi:hypothetical protein V7652_26095, partial [Bacillus thuringiensis]|uniref:hypothetical protein n=1 Tax=Bacillus thuringiensis TaxID=1428 RepID=UPI003000CE66